MGKLKIAMSSTGTVGRGFGGERVVFSRGVLSRGKALWQAARAFPEWPEKRV